MKNDCFVDTIQKLGCEAILEVADDGSGRITYVGVTTAPFEATVILKMTPLPFQEAPSVWCDCTGTE